MGTWVGQSGSLQMQDKEFRLRSLNVESSILLLREGETLRTRHPEHERGSSEQGSVAWSGGEGRKPGRKLPLPFPGPLNRKPRNAPGLPNSQPYLLFDDQHLRITPVSHRPIFPPDCKLLIPPTPYEVPSTSVLRERRFARSRPREK